MARGGEGRYSPGLYRERLARALERFEERQSGGAEQIVQSTSSSAADRVSEHHAGPGARQTVDVLAERLWWLTQGISMLPMPTDSQGKAPYRRAARMVLAQVGYPEWKRACDAAEAILNRPTPDEQGWMDVCTWPTGWIGPVVKRTMRKIAAGAGLVEAERELPELPEALLKRWDAALLWARVMAVVRMRWLTVTASMFDGSNAEWDLDAKVLRVVAPHYAPGPVDYEGQLERIASMIAEENVPILLVVKAA